MAAEGAATAENGVKEAETVGAVRRRGLQAGAESVDAAAAAAAKEGGATTKSSSSSSSGPAGIMHNRARHQAQQHEHEHEHEHGHEPGRARMRMSTGYSIQHAQHRAQRSTWHGSRAQRERRNETQNKRAAHTRAAHTHTKCMHAHKAIHNAETQGSGQQPLIISQSVSQSLQIVTCNQWGCIGRGCAHSRG